MALVSQICAIVLLVVMSFNVIVPAECASILLNKISKRSTEQNLCIEQSPCGWAIYDEKRENKPQLFFMKNSCTCGPERQCARSNEDLSTASYVYRCKMNNP